MFIPAQMQLLYLRDLVNVVRRLLCHVPWRADQVTRCCSFHFIFIFFPAAKLHYKALNRRSIFSLYKFIVQQLLQLNSVKVCDCKWEVAISVIRKGKDVPAKQLLHYNIAHTINTLPRGVPLLSYTVYVLCWFRLELHSKSCLWIYRLSLWRQNCASLFI